MPKQKLRPLSPQAKTTKKGNWRRPRTGDTGRRVAIYSSAYRLAWEQISSTERRERPDISLRIHASIRRQLKAGEIDARVIAFAALKEALVPNTH